ncbi:MAG: class I SAM-dependent methyltransferase [Octadecabacter sp.]|nr:class I SAM-dependent methyltransferase [Octadecabacter sp.]
MSAEPSTRQAFENSPYKSLKWETYFHVYDRLLAPYVGKEITFVEIGILNGGSLFMWREFFGPQARIVGLDFNPLAERWREYGFEIHIGSQSDVAFWKETLPKIGPIDVLLDDGGHMFDQQIITCEQVLPSIRDGGLLVVEDTHTSYMKGFGAPHRHSFIDYAKNICDGINYRYADFAKDRPSETVIQSVQFFESIVAFEINRPLCAILPKFGENNGESLSADGFRYHGTLRERYDLFAEQNAGIFDLPVIGRSLYKVFRSIRKRALRRDLRRTNDGLKPYFKY